MNSSNVSPKFLCFINEHQNDDVNRLRLQWHGRGNDIDIDFAIIQIECRRKCRTKLSNFLQKETFLFPSVVASEQASHQAVARYHADTFGQKGTLLDMTAGLGIDAFSFSKAGMKVVAYEIDEKKSAILRHNSEILRLSNFDVTNGDSVEYIRKEKIYFDIIFIDPARRKENNSRVYNFRDCEPDILSIQDDIQECCGRLLIKGSPLLDITQTLRDIHNVKSVHVVSVEGECKEILIEAGKNGGGVYFKAIDLHKDGHIISELEYAESNLMEYCEFASGIKPGMFLYEPNASVMKLAPWGILTNQFPAIRKLGKDSHLFISECYYEKFPGRILTIEKIITKKDRKSLKGLPANIVTRNYPLTADNLRKILRMKEGSDSFLYGTRIGKEPILILCRKVNPNVNQNR